MNVEELVKALEAQRAENQTLRNDLAKALESLEQAQKQRKLCASEKPGPVATSTNS